MERKGRSRTHEMTELSSFPQIVPREPAVATPPSKQPAPAPTPTPVPPPPQQSPLPQQTTASGAASQTGIGGGIPYQLQYDAETRRFILEARDPKTGAVIVEMPPQSALQQIQATAAVTDNSPLGTSVDKSA